MIHLNLRQRLRLRLQGSVFVYTKDLGKGKLRYYAMRCKVHGLVTDYPHGFHQELSCPKCVRDRIKSWRLSQMRRLGVD